MIILCDKKNTLFGIFEPTKKHFQRTTSCDISHIQEVAFATKSVYSNYKHFPPNKLSSWIFRSLNYKGLTHRVKIKQSTRRPGELTERNNYSFPVSTYLK